MSNERFMETGDVHTSEKIVDGKAVTVKSDDRRMQSPNPTPKTKKDDEDEESTS